MKNDVRKNSHKIKRNLIKEGNFSKISNSNLFDNKLTDSALRLLIAISNSTLPVISITYFGKKFDWSKSKLTSAVKCLENNGYLKVDKYPKGKSKGYYYFYTISEFGNLNNKPSKDFEYEFSDDFIKLISKYEDLLQYEWFKTIILESKGDPDLFEDKLYVFLNSNYGT